MFGSYEFLPFGFMDRPKKTTAKKKKKQQHWSGANTVDELKELCRAAKLNVSGTKVQLQERLKTCSAWTEYSGFLEDLKRKCREKGLIVSGKRQQLILRLLQDENGTGQPKRSAGTINDDGNFQPKKRAKSMKLPEVDMLTERAYKKAHPPDSVTNKWGNWTYKQHYSRCVQFTNETIDREVFQKLLFERGEEEVAWQVIFAVLQFIIYEYEAQLNECRAKIARMPKGSMVMAPTPFKPTGKGYAETDVQFKLFPKLIEAMKATSSRQKLFELGASKLLRDLESELRIFKDEKFSAALNEYLGVHDEASVGDSENDADNED
jgi:hypothetical protein